VVADCCAALPLEAKATCAMTAAGHEVFGQNPGVLCPARGWPDDDTPRWGRNWRNRTVSDAGIQLVYSIVDFIRLGVARATAGAA